MWIYGSRSDIEFREKYGHSRRVGGKPPALRVGTAWCRLPPSPLFSTGTIALVHDGGVLLLSFTAWRDRRFSRAPADLGEPPIPPFGERPLPQHPTAHARGTRRRGVRGASWAGGERLG